MNLPELLLAWVLLFLALFTIKRKYALENLNHVLLLSINQIFYLLMITIRFAEFAVLSSSLWFKILFLDLKNICLVEEWLKDLFLYLSHQIKLETLFASSFLTLNFQDLGVSFKKCNSQLSKCVCVCFGYLSMHTESSSCFWIWILSQLEAIVQVFHRFCRISALCASAVCVAKCFSLFFGNLATGSRNP